MIVQKKTQIFMILLAQAYFRKTVLTFAKYSYLTYFYNFHSIKSIQSFSWKQQTSTKSSSHCE